MVHCLRRECLRLRLHEPLDVSRRQLVQRVSQGVARNIELARYTWQVYHLIHAVELSKVAKKQLASVPTHVADKLFDWVEAVQKFGLESVRQRPGLHDEPLKGERAGQRSIRLSKSWRAIYVIRSVGVEVTFVKEVTHHAY